MEEKAIFKNMKTNVGFKSAFAVASSAQERWSATDVAHLCQLLSASVTVLFFILVMNCQM